MSALAALVAACNSKACAPPPFGTGGSLRKKGGHIPLSPENEKRLSDATAATASQADRALSAMWDEGSRGVQQAGDALDAYTGNGYKQTNAFLRDNEPPARRPGHVMSDSEMVQDEDLAAVHGMDEAFRRASVPMVDDGVVYRGAIAGAGGMPIPYAGMRLHDDAFVSTSTMMSNARDFTTVGAGRRVLMQLIIPKGTHVLAGVGYENELILDRGSSFHVLSVEHDVQSNMTTVVARMMNKNGTVG